MTGSPVVVEPADEAELREPATKEGLGQPVPLLSGQRLAVLAQFKGMRTDEAS